MTITREQVEDLQPGDVVEYRRDEWPEGALIRSPLWAGPDPIGKALYVLEGHFGVRDEFGDAYAHVDGLTVVSRAPRPLYVNHPRTEPVLGDVVRDGKGEIRYAMPRKATATGDGTCEAKDPRWWASVAEYDGEWLHCSTYYMPRPLTLLVDGETGQVVK